MDHTLNLQQTYLQPRKEVGRTLRTIIRALADEHALALYAATKAASPRETLAETRALYVPSSESAHQDNAGTPNGTPLT